MGNRKNLPANELLYYRIIHQPPPPPTQSLYTLFASPSIASSEAALSFRFIIKYYMLNGHANQHPLANFPGIKSHPSVRPFLPQSFHTRSRHSGSVAFCNRVRIFNLLCLYYLRVMLMMIVNKILILKLIILGAKAIQHSQLFSEPQCHCFFIQLFPYIIT